MWFIDVIIQIANDHDVIKIHMHSINASCTIVIKSRTRHRRGPINTNNCPFPTEYCNFDNYMFYVTAQDQDVDWQEDLL